MKKVLVPTLTILGALAFASAEDVQTGMQVQAQTGTRPPMVSNMMGRFMGTSTGTSSMQRPVVSRLMKIFGEGTALSVVGLTGDATTDSQIIALRQDTEAKLKALTDDYQTKLKAIVGDKKLSMPGKNMLQDMKGRAEGALDRMRNGSSTEGQDRGDEDHMMGSGTQPMPGNDNRGRFPRMLPPQGGTSSQPVQPVSAIRSFFQSLFGGNQVEAQVQAQ